MRRKTLVGILSGAIAVALAAAGLVLLREKKTPPLPPLPDFPYAQMQEGDLIFRTGTGLYSQMLNISTDSVQYSHVGLLVRPDSVWEVVHAVPKELESPEDFERVKREPLERFLSHELALHAAFVHTGLPRQERMIRTALQWAQDSVRFDSQFDLEDSTALYCTELVWRLYRREGIDLSEGRRSYETLGFFPNGGILTPDDLYRFSGKQLYFRY